MLEKRDLQLVRLAVRRKWLTAEEGEDCLFLKRKLGAKYTIEEVIRKRGYLDDAAIEELSVASADLTRRRPVASPRAAAPAPTPAATPGARVARPPAPTHHDAPPATVESAPPSAVLEALGQRAGGAARTAAPSPARPPPAATPARGPTAPARVPGRAPPPATTPARVSAPPPPRTAPAARTAPRPGAPPQAATPPRGAQARGTSEEFDVSTLLETPALNLPEGTPAPAEEATILGMAAITPDMLGELGEIGSGAEEKTVVGLRVEDLVRAREAAPAPPAPSVVLRAPMDAPPAPAPARRTWDKSPPAQGRKAGMRVATMYGPPPTEWGSAEESITGPGTAAPLPGSASVQLVRPVVSEATVPGEADDESLSGTLGPYAIRRLIGRGSMGVVYLAEPVDGGEPVALKLLRRDLLRSAEHLERFRREAYAAAAIDSPYVVPVMGVGSVDGRPYIALRYIEGFTLRERLDADEPPELAETLRIARDVGRALMAARAAGIVHRDVKPENIIVTGAGDVYLTDFGLAREVSAAVEGLTAISDSVVGTPNYMAPEQAMGMAVDDRTDLYALGCTLFHVLVGRPPFSGKSSVSIIAKQVREAPPDPAAIDPAIPAPVAAIIRRLMNKIPEQRFASAAELVAALEAVLDTMAPAPRAPERVIGAVAVRSFAAASAVVAASMGVAVLARTKGMAVWGRPGIGVEASLGGAGLVVLAMLMLGAIGLVRRGELPLPGSTSWLVSIKDATGVLGAALAVAAAALGPPAGLDVLVLALGVLVLASWVFGYLLRTAIARQRKDRGGHVLALFGDLRLRRWRRVHVPLLMSLAGLATVRFAMLAYFRS